MDSQLARRTALGGALVLGVVVLVLLQLGRGLEYWDFSEGVYALSSRLLLHGHGLYGDVVAAQPPGIFLFGALALALHDSLGTLRLAVGLAELAGALVAAHAVWRLTASRLLTALTPVVYLLTPWAVHEHGSLLPETLAPLLLLPAALLLARPEHVRIGAVLAGAAVMVKLSFALPAVVLVLAARRRREAAVWALGTLVVLALAATLVFGTDVWRDIVVAQARIGRDSVRHVGQKWAQEAWGLAGLVLAAALCWPRRREPLVRMLLALAAGMLLTGLTNVKVGTSLIIVVPIEAALVPLAMTAFALGRRTALIAAVALAFTLAQTVTLLAIKPTATPFLYPGSQRGAWGRVLSDSAVAARVKAIRASCPRGVPYGGPPFLAMAAGRSEPLDQPDGFLTSYSPTFADLHARVAAVRPVCPP